MENTNKTDLSVILSVSGKRGLFLYVSQARNGAIVEAMSDKKRYCFDIKSKITSLADISIYTDDGEIKLKEVLIKLKSVLEGSDAPTSKDDSETLKSLFAKAVPNYDADRFYVSHMKKIAEWYNELKHYASLDFKDDTEAEESNTSVE